MSTNTRIDTIVVIRVLPAQPGDVISDALASELERRITAYLEIDGSVGEVVIATGPPEDTTKVWYPSDENGVPKGTAYVYNVSTQSWEPAIPEIPDPTCLNDDPNNLIEEDSNGCLVVWPSSVKDVMEDDLVDISNSVPKISSDPDNTIETDELGYWLVKQEQSYVPWLATDPPLLVDEDTPAGNIDVNAVIPIPTGATHALISTPSGKMFSKLSGNFIGHETTATGQHIYLLGYIRGETLS